MKKELVTIEEFFQLTLLSERDLLTMLSRGEILSERGTGGELLLDISTLSDSQLAQRGKSAPLGIKESELELYEEIIASEVLGAVEQLLDESFELALKWQGQTKEESEL